LLEEAEAPLSKSQRSVTRAFRIDGPAFVAIQEEAKKRRISVNTLVNQLFLSFADVDRHFQNMRMTRVPNGMLRELLRSVPDEKLKQLSEELSPSVCETFAMSVYGEFSLSTAIAALRRISLFRGIEYNEVVRAGTTTITLTHSLGLQYSTFESQILKSLFEKLGVRPKIRSNSDSVSLEFGSAVESSGNHRPSQQYTTKNTS
jgi:hypothetical protein